MSLEDECVGMFSSEGRPCAACGSMRGCVDRLTGVYCTDGPCLSDAACRSEPETVLGRRRR